MTVSLIVVNIYLRQDSHCAAVMLATYECLLCVLVTLCSDVLVTYVMMVMRMVMGDKRCEYSSGDDEVCTPYCVALPPLPTIPPFTPDFQAR